jgi:CHAT domain-containing protein
LRTELAGADVGHLACHFDLDLVDPRTSVLRLGRGITLDALLHAPGCLPHLVLSACDAGLSGTRLPDEAIGPAAMLMHGGARSVLAPLWPVDDELTVMFMRSYHRRLAGGVEPATALSQTRREARAGEAQHPAIWACWTHTGP